ncbi:MAG: NAD-dependent epimerase/dehydratase family protein [Halobacteriales archaeon]
MRVVVIGGTGHVGTYLVPRLVAAGHDVVNVSRGERDPYLPHAAWEAVEHVSLDREAAEADGEFGDRIAALDPDAVVDMICFEPESAERIVAALRGEVRMYLFCGTVWVHGHSTAVPTTEDREREPFGEYGIKKAEIESRLLEAARAGGFPATALHPGHIVGPGWEPLNPEGHFDPAVFERIAHGGTVRLPNRGLETVHHVHADDVAQAFQAALENWGAAVGESFHVASPQALTLRGFARGMADWFGSDPDLEYVPWPEFEERLPEERVESTYDHIEHSPNCSIAKARDLLGYEPRYSSLAGVQEAVEWLIEHDEVGVPDGVEVSAL